MPLHACMRVPTRAHTPARARPFGDWILNLCVCDCHSCKHRVVIGRLPRRGSRGRDSDANSLIDTCSCMADAVVSFEVEHGAWSLEACDVVVGQGRKGIAVGSSTHLAIKCANISGFGSCLGEGPAVHGLGRCALQAFDESRLELSECTVRFCRQAFALFDSAHAHLDACCLDLPPQSFALALNDETHAALSGVEVTQAPMPSYPSAAQPQDSAAESAEDGRSGVARSGVLWASPGEPRSAHVVPQSCQQGRLALMGCRAGA